mmetsp:Transcript_79534/g.257581  ORF Transcript_79534/g.257581 Transcript_79534/m.257581 type:complete len:242 (-) Transcript_79534:1594-2319(-)
MSPALALCCRPRSRAADLVMQTVLEFGVPVQAARPVPQPKPLAQSWVPHPAGELIRRLQLQLALRVVSVQSARVSLPQQATPPETRQELPKLPVHPQAHLFCQMSYQLAQPPPQAHLLCQTSFPLAQPPPLSVEHPPPWGQPRLKSTQHPPPSAAHLRVWRRVREMPPRLMQQPAAEEAEARTHRWSVQLQRMQRLRHQHQQHHQQQHQQQQQRQRPKQSAPQKSLPRLVLWFLPEHHRPN